MLKRLTISFTPEESRALQRMVETDFRPPKDQVRWLLRREAEKRGLLPGNTQEHKQRDGGAVDVRR